MMPTRTLFVLLTLVGFVASTSGDDRPKGPKTEIENFNKKFIELVSKTDHAGMLATWADNGVDLMPGEAPIVGRGAIAAWLAGIEASMPGSMVSKQEMEFHDIQVCGDWASEWATEHQIVLAPGKPPIEGYGKIALVLHRDESGRWKIKQEMWNGMPRP